MPLKEIETASVTQKQKKMKKRQVLKFNADELCKTHYKRQHARTLKSTKGTSTKLQNKMQLFFAEKDSAKPTKPTDGLQLQNI